MSKLNPWKLAFAVFVIFATTIIEAPAQTVTFTTLANFDDSNGLSPEEMSLVQGVDGDFYGTTFGGGANGFGTVFKITAGGMLTSLYSFDGSNSGSDGAYPRAGLVLAIDGNFYGTTQNGGVYGDGTVFKITPGGTLTTLYSFCSKANCPDGAYPLAGLIQATDGSFYGTTYGGGAYSNSTYCPVLTYQVNGGCGTVFKITPGGTLTTLYSFCFQTNCTDGTNPKAELVQAANGNFYGIATDGGGSQGANCLLQFIYGCGTVFEITPAGKLTTQHRFDFSDGAGPVAGLVQGTDGNFYGLTPLGGAGYCTFGSPVPDYGCGTVFKITPGGTLTTLHSFCIATNCPDGGSPYAPLVQGTDGNFYGTAGAGPYCCGEVFQITPGGTVTILQGFVGVYVQYDGLLQGTDGTFYGTTLDGGVNNEGSVFSLSVGLGPFIKTVPTSGPEGVPVIILGNNLTGSTGVTFNGIEAAFSVVSSFEIMTTVPTFASSGAVQVTTPSGILLSNVVFDVPPTVTITGSVPQALTRDGSGNYVANVTLTNNGNVVLNTVQVTLAGTTLGSGSLLAAPSPVTNLAIGASATVTLTFPPSSVPATAQTAALKVSGTYSVANPSHSGDWGVSFRSVSL